MRPQVREEYRCLARHELADRAYDLGFYYTKNSGSCAQSVVAALHELFEMESTVVKVATSSSGGQALQTIGTCGALIGGTIVLDYFFGRPAENMSCQEEIQANVDLLFEAIGVASLLAERFWREYKAIQCIMLQRQLYGRTYWLADPHDRAKFIEAGAHSDPRKCMHVVGSTAKWVVEILINKGLTKVS